MKITLHIKIFLLLLILKLTHSLLRKKSTKTIKQELNILPSNYDTEGWNINSSSGDILQLALRASSGTGYSWYLDNANDIDNDILIPLNLKSDNRGVNKEIEGSDKNARGRPFHHVFEFAALSPGQVELHFSLKRPWMKKAGKSVIATLTVE